MVLRVVWTRKALDDLRAIKVYISRDSVRYAQLQIEKIRSAASRIGQLPKAGRALPEFPDEVWREVLIGAFGKALVATISGNELKRLYATHGYALFDRNVRLFLGARKGSVNAGIRDTLGSTKERKNFWAYNNGLRFICDRYELDEDTYELTLHNFSVVNGCQTTVSVANASAAAAKDVSLLARFISSPEEAVVDSVITYTNRQTPIQPWDISSQDAEETEEGVCRSSKSLPLYPEARRASPVVRY